MKGKATFTKEQEQTVTGFVPGHSYAETAKFIQDQCGIAMMNDQVKRWIKNHHLNTGRDGRFKKGQSKNRYSFKPGEHFSPKTEFKRGHRPANWKPIGTVITKGDGYLWTKISDEGPSYQRWRQTHILNWEQQNGPVPQGMRLVFLDGDHNNVDVSNLSLVSNSELLALNRRKLASSDPLVTQTAVLIARLDVKSNGIRKAESIHRHR